MAQGMLTGIGLLPIGAGTDVTEEVAQLNPQAGRADQRRAAALSVVICRWRAPWHWCLPCARAARQERMEPDDDCYTFNDFPVIPPAASNDLGARNSRPRNADDGGELELQLIDPPHWRPNTRCVRLDRSGVKKAFSR